MAKILVIEDDKGLSALLSKWLKDEQHVVDIADTGEDALQLLDCFNYDLLILDWGLPGIQGDRVCARYRAKGGVSPILFLTGRIDLESKEMGLDAGADDYLTKPFAVEELAARVKALLRRVAVSSDEFLSCPGLKLYLNRCMAVVAEEKIKLSVKEFEVLKFLLQHQDQAFSSRELLKRVWPADGATAEQTVRSTIHALRKKLSAREEDCVIKTIPKVGFVIESGSDKKSV